MQALLQIVLNLLKRKKPRKNLVKLHNNLKINIKRIKSRLFNQLEKLNMMKKFKCLGRLKSLRHSQELFKLWQVILIQEMLVRKMFILVMDLRRRNVG